MFTSAFQDFHSVSLWVNESLLPFHCNIRWGAHTACGRNRRKRSWYLRSSSQIPTLGNRWSSEESNSRLVSMTCHVAVTKPPPKATQGRKVSFVRPTWGFHPAWRGSQSSTGCRLPNWEFDTESTVRKQSEVNATGELVFFSWDPSGISGHRMIVPTFREHLPTSVRLM